MDEAYDRGHAKMRDLLMKQRPTTDQAFGMLTSLRGQRKAHRPNSPEWNRLIGGTVALLQAFPHLANHQRKVKR